MSASKQMKPAEMRYSSTIAAIAIFVVSLICYSQTFHTPFLYDDIAYFIDGALFEGEAAPVTRHTTLYAIWNFNAARFITFSTFAINYRLGGVDTFGYHVFNFFVHLLSSLSLFFFTRLIVKNMPTPAQGMDADKQFAFLFPLLVALIFSAHPIQTEAVTYIWQRSTSLAALFYLLSMTLYLQSAHAQRGERESKIGSNIILTLSVVFGVFAMFTKQIAVTLPVAIILVDLCFISGSFGALKKRSAKWGMFILVLMIIPALTLFGMNREMRDIGTRSHNILSPVDYLITQFNVVVHYISLLLFPAGQNLDYDFPVAHSILDALASFILLILILLGGVLCFKRLKVVSFGIFFFFLALSVESTIFPLEDLIFEHRLYLPSAGFFIVAGWLVFYFMKKVTPLNSSKVFVLACVFLLAPLMVSTIQRNQTLESRETLWRDVTQKSPNKPRGHIILGNLAFQKKDWLAAHKYYLRAYEINPKAPLAALAIYSMGHVYEKEGKQAMAMEEYQKALQINSRLAIAHYSIAEADLKSGDNRGAIAHYLKAMSARPGSLDIRLKLGNVLRITGHLDNAILVYKGIIEKRPDIGEAYFSLGLIYSSLNKPREARTNFRMAKEKGYTTPDPAKNE